MTDRKKPRKQRRIARRAARLFALNERRWAVTYVFDVNTEMYIGRFF